MIVGLTFTWFLVSWSRSTQWSNGTPCISSIASTLGPESSSITSGTWKKSSPSNRDLKVRESFAHQEASVQQSLIPLHTPEPLDTFCLPIVVTLPGQLSLKNLQAAICKQTCGDINAKKKVFKQTWWGNAHPASWLQDIILQNTQFF